MYRVLFAFIIPVRVVLLESILLVRLVFRLVRLLNRLVMPVNRLEINDAWLVLSRRRIDMSPARLVLSRCCWVLLD